MVLPAWRETRLPPLRRRLCCHRRRCRSRTCAHWPSTAPTRYRRRQHLGRTALRSARLCAERQRHGSRGNALSDLARRQDHRHRRLVVGRPLRAYGSEIRRDQERQADLGRPQGGPRNRLLSHRELAQPRAAAPARLPDCLLPGQNQSRLRRLDPRRCHHRGVSPARTAATTRTTPAGPRGTKAQHWRFFETRPVLCKPAVPNRLWAWDRMEDRVSRPLVRSGRMDPLRLSSLAYGLLTSTLIIAFLYVGRPILEPLVIASLLAFILSPLIRRLRQWGLLRVPSVFIAGVFSFGVRRAPGALLALPVRAPPDRFAA